MKRTRLNRKNKLLGLHSLVPLHYAFVAILITVACLVFFLQRTPRTAKDQQPLGQPEAFLSESYSGEVTQKNVPETSATSCAGNEQEMCVLAPSVDFWPSGNEDAYNHDYVAPDQAQSKEIGGEVTAHEGNNVILKSSTGKLFTVKFPLDAITWWNQTRASYYKNYQIGVGDRLEVRYGESLGKSETTILGSSITTSVLIIKNDNSIYNGGISRYTGE